MADSVEVLLSTFRSGPYLSQQLDSVWSQDYPDVALVVRDDGSDDGTAIHVERCLAGRTRARFIAGDHTGAGKSFLALLREVSPATVYAAFCDQDDVWLPGKLSAAVKVLQGQQGPAFYCSAVELVDARTRENKDPPSLRAWAIVRERAGRKHCYRLHHRPQPAGCGAAFG